MSKRRYGVAVAVGALLLSLTVGVGPASASCDPEHNIFVEKNHNAPAWGSNHWIHITDRDIDSGCGSGAEAVSTTVVGNSSYNRWVELGYQEDLQSGQHRFRGFTEWGDLATGAGAGPHFFDEVTLTVGEWDKFKLNQVDGTDDEWNFYVDKGANGNYVRISRTYHTGFHHGYAFGETQLRGPNTGARDKHTHMIFKQCPAGQSCSWEDWKDNFLSANWGDGISGWHYQRINDTAYCVIQDSTCPTW